MSSNHHIEKTWLMKNITNKKGRGATKISAIHCYGLLINGILLAPQIPVNNTSEMVQNKTAPLSKTDNDIDNVEKIEKKDSFTKSVSRLFSVISGEWKILSLGVVGMLISSGTNMLFPKIMGKTIDIACGKAAPYNLSKRNFILLVFSTFCVGSAASFLRVYCFGMVAERSASRIRKKLYSKVMHQNAEYFDKNNVGEIIHRLNSDSQVLADSVVNVFVNSFRALNSIIGSSIMLLFISPSLTIVSLSVLPLVGSGIMIFSKYNKSSAKKHKDLLCKLMGVAEERIQNIQTVKIFAQEETELRYFDSKVDELYKLAMRTQTSRSWFMASTSLSINASLFSVLYFGGSLVQRGELTMGSLTSFALYSGFLGLGFSSISSCFGEIRRLTESSYCLDGLDECEAMEKMNKITMLDQLQGPISFKDVVFVYPSRPETKVLSSFNLNIIPGSSVALVGPSGSGKSTIVKLLLGLYDVNEGNISMDGNDINVFTSSSLRRRIGVVNQEPTLFSGSISMNIAYGMKSPSIEDIISAAKQANAHDFIMKLPNQYATLVGERGSQLSGGQKQRIAIARAIIKNPDLLILDEATSSLDGESEHAVKVAIENVMKDRTVLIIAHRLKTIQQVDIVVVIEEGRVVQTGTYSELCKKGGYFARLHDIDQVLSN